MEVFVHFSRFLGDFITGGAEDARFRNFASFSACHVA